ncbi:MAG TPA: ATP synthase F0 subunit B [Bryobacteraceae bacterium]|jgi:F-type H+-transporting ATPase subunit b|nr:ATP synthase F0 subunit B [Bryobacteraceae bacterium]
MEQTLHALAGILLKSIPTVVLLLFLYFYLKLMLFGPLARVLKQREELTAGTRHAAQNSLKDAERKVQEYEAKMREARAEVYREQEETRKRWITDQASQIDSARERAGQTVQQAKEQMTVEITAARQSLAESAGVLADQIATTVLARRA